MSNANLTKLEIQVQIMWTDFKRIKRSWNERQDEDRDHHL
jgi:hypothetical protein